MAAGMAKQGGTRVCRLFHLPAAQHDMPFMMWPLTDCMWSLPWTVPVWWATMERPTTVFLTWPIWIRIPGMKVYAPANFPELDRMLEQAVCQDSGPVAVRHPPGEAKVVIRKTRAKKCSHIKDWQGYYLWQGTAWR